MLAMKWQGSDQSHTGSPVLWSSAFLDPLLEEGREHTGPRAPLFVLQVACLLISPLAHMLWNNRTANDISVFYVSMLKQQGG